MTPERSRGVQVEWLEFLARNRGSLLRYTRVACGQVGDRQVEDAVDAAVEKMVSLFEQHPDWPDAKFPSKSALLAYVATAAKRNCLRLIQLSVREAPLDLVSGEGQEKFEALLEADRHGIFASRQAAGARLTSLIGPIDRSVLLLRYEGATLAEIAQSMPDARLRPEHVLERLLVLQHAYPWLCDVLPPLTRTEALSEGRKLASSRTPPLIALDVEVLAGRFAGEPFEALAGRLTDSGLLNARGETYNANALRQRMARLLQGQHGVWIRRRLPTDRIA